MMASFSGSGEAISNMKRAEEAMAKLEAQKLSKEDVGLGELSKMEPANATEFIEKMKGERVAWETRQREAAEKQAQVEKFKIKKTSKVGTADSQQAREQRERKLKASVDAVKKMNADIQHVQLLLGKLIQTIDGNERTFAEEPYFKVKAQRLKRMLTAYYYGLNTGIIKPKLFDAR